MIQNTQTFNSSEHIGEIQENKVGIDIKNIDFITSLLTSNLYSNPVESFLRESVSNAYDSHVEAGTKQHIILIIDYLNNDEFKLTLRDYGTGLSPERFNEIYRNIGSSTKRDSNDYIGCFGLGHFVALSCATACSIISYHNNVRYDYIMYKNEKNINIDKINETKGDYKNGLEIQVTVKSSFSILEEAITKLCFFENLYIQYNSHNYSPYYGYRAVNFDDFVNDFNKRKCVRYNYVSYCDFLNRYNIYGNFVKVGSVLYKSYDYTFHSVGLVVNIPIGSVDITPSRESLQFTDYTDNTLKVYYEKAKVELKSIVDNNLKKEISVFDFFKQIVDSRTIKVNCDNIDFVIEKNDVQIFTSLFTCDGENYPDKFLEFINEIRWNAIDKSFIYKKCSKYRLGNLSINTLLNKNMVLYEKGDAATKASTVEYYASEACHNYVIFQPGINNLLKTSFSGVKNTYSDCYDFFIKHLNIKKIFNSDVPKSYLDNSKPNKNKPKNNPNEQLRHYNRWGGYSIVSTRFLESCDGCFVLYSQNTKEDNIFRQINSAFNIGKFELFTAKKESLKMFENNRKFVRVEDFLYKRNKFIEKFTTAYIIMKSFEGINPYDIPIYTEFNTKYYKYACKLRNYPDTFTKDTLNRYIENKWYNEYDVNYFSLSERDRKIIKFKNCIRDHSNNLVNYEVYKQCGRSDKLGIKPVLKPQFKL